MLKYLLMLINKIMSFYKIEKKKIIIAEKESVNIQNVTKAIFLTIRDKVRLSSFDISYISNNIDIDDLVSIRNIRAYCNCRVSITLKFTIYVSDYVCMSCVVSDWDYNKFRGDITHIRINDILELPDPVGEEINKWSNKIINVEIERLKEIEMINMKELENVRDKVIELSKNYYFKGE